MLKLRVKAWHVDEGELRFLILADVILKCLLGTMLEVVVRQTNSMQAFALKDHLLAGDVK